MRLEEMIATYDLVWSEADDRERRRLLELPWADDGELVDPDRMDFAEVAEDGRLRRVVMLFGVLPSLAP